MKKFKNYNLKLKITSILFFTFYVLGFIFAPAVRADPQPSSSSYQLLDYGFGSGGTVKSSSNNFQLQGISGEIEFASPSSSNFILWPGLTYALEPNVPPAPTLTNPSNYYNKLSISINQGNNPTDTTYAIEISTDNFVSNITYVQADGTLGSSAVWQSYTLWGGASGTTIIGLNPGTTYYARVAAKRGTFQQGAFGPSATATTVNPSFSFAIQTTSQSTPPFSIYIGQLNAGAVTTSSDQATATISTNATGGGTVYLYGANTGLLSTYAGSYTIPSVSNDLNSLLQGYGAQGTSISQTSGGPMEILSPYNGTSNTVGVIDTSKRPLADSTSSPVTNGQVSFDLKAKASNTTPAATDYSDTLTIIASGSF